MAIDPSTAFVSYGREDWEFVLRLAKDLKAKGAKVWMDKLDIRPGQRWEQQVETALHACSRMLVILSPASVASTNVMAEAAFAIDEGKEVIPVLYLDCKIPFRLRPFQYADFRTSYHEGLQELLASLGSERAASETATATPTVTTTPATVLSEGERQAEEEQEFKQLATEKSRAEQQERKRSVTTVETGIQDSARAPKAAPAALLIAGTKTRQWPRFDLSVFPSLRDVSRKLLVVSCKFASHVWRTLPSYLPFYLLATVVGYAAWQALTPVTIIVPFQLPKADMPFTGEIVADAVQDGLKSIRNHIDEERRDASLRPSDTGLPDLRNMLIPDFWRVQAPPRFTVEVKGISYERILSLARGVLGTETTITGNVLLNEDKFILIARAPDAGPWESVLSPISAEGLKQASRDLAEKILITRDPTVAGVAMLKDGRVDEGLDLLNRARSLNPSDERLKLNLCMGFAASRRYDEAIGCYRELLNKNSNPTQEMSEGLAQALFLIGDRQAAIDIYENLVHGGFKTALLGLGEALDNNDRHDEAIMKYDEFLSGQHHDRDLAIAHVKKGVALSHLGRHTEALSEYQRALKYAPRDVLVLVNNGVELAQTRDLDAGIAQLKSVVDENPGSHSLPFVRLQLGSLLEKKGDWRGAIGEYEKAAQLRPTYVEAHLKLAHALVHEGDQAKALNQYKEVAKLSPSDLERGYSDIFANQWLGNALRDQANYSGAMEAYQAAILLEPDFSAAHCQLGLILSRQGNRRLSIQHLQAALVPPKSKELSDDDCVLMAQRLLAESAPNVGSQNQPR